MAPLLHQEITALRRIAVQDNAVDSEAFGPAYPNSVQALTAPHYHFTIRRSGTAGLELLIDAYSAWTAPTDHDFDVQACEEQQLEFESSQASRRSYRELHRVARSVLAGAAIRLADGQVRNFKREAKQCAATL